MKSFSERMGLKPVKELIQKDSMDDDLRIGLWNLLQLSYWPSNNNPIDNPENKSLKTFFSLLWHNYFRRPIDTMDGFTFQIIYEIRKYYFSCKWYEVYDFIEYCAEHYPIKLKSDVFMTLCNDELEKELSAYRFVGGKITPITSDEEISEIEDALQIPQQPVRKHLKRSLELLSDRENPDYRNSIKESISAVESMCKIITDDGNIRTALIKIRKDLSLHDNLKTAFQNLYSYTSDASGIRHCMTADPDVGQEEAKFMLVTCSAFVNYLVVKASKAGIDLSTPSSK